MTDFLIKSTISLLALLLFYHLILEKEKMFHFSRHFLLISLLFSIGIPFISFKIQQDIPVIHNNTITQHIVETSPVTPAPLPIQEITTLSPEEQTNYWLPVLWITYILITLVLSFRFIRNIYTITCRAKRSKVIIHQNTRMVLVSENTLPYTFWDTIYINQKDFENRQIEPELFTHEITHVEQKHTLDVIFIEILKTLFWFNPIFIFYKKAIQLNHEFLADENVLFTHRDVPFYQNLLLNKVSISRPFLLASNLNFLATKKRLTMMTKITSKPKAIMMKLAILALFMGLTTTLCAQFYPSEELKLQISQNKKAIIVDENSKHFKKDFEIPINDRQENKTVASIANPTSRSLKNNNESALLQNKKIIVIDAGHGGYDSGAQFGDEQESKIVANIAQKIKTLNKGEIEIILLREEDRFIDLSERVSKINKINPSLVISLHVNSNKDSHKNGIDVYVSKQNIHYEKSIESATNLVDKISNDKLAKGEVKDAPFFVIKNSKCPALVIEIGYLSNEKDRSYLTSENGQNEIANNIFEFIRT